MGVNEQSAFLVDPSGAATLAGPRAPAAFICELCAKPDVCEPGQRLTAGPYECVRVEGAGSAYDFGTWSAVTSTSSVSYVLSVNRGVISGSPYGP